MLDKGRAPERTLVFVLRLLVFGSFPSRIGSSAPHHPDGDDDNQDGCEDDQDDQEVLGDSHAVVLLSGLDRCDGGHGCGVCGSRIADSEGECLHVGGDGDLSIGDCCTVEGDLASLVLVAVCGLVGDLVGSNGEGIVSRFRAAIGKWFFL